MSDDTLLDRLARLRGLGEAYHDYRGELRRFSRATQRGILAAMGCRVDDEAALAAAIVELEGQRWASLLPPVIVLRPGHRAVTVAVAADALERRLAWTLRCDSGQVLEGSEIAGNLAEIERGSIDGRTATRRALTLPVDPPLGTHVFEARLGDGSPLRATLIAAPERCVEPTVLERGGRVYGVAAQLYTLRTTHNWGIGDFGDLQELIRHAAAHGAGFVGLNPLHALFPSNPWHFSPYSPSSRHFLNVLYIAVPLLPECAASSAVQRRLAEPNFQAELARLRATDLVDYGGVANAKLPILRLLHAEFRARRASDPAASRDFVAYRAERGELLRHQSLHDALDEHLRGRDPALWGWPVWPEQYRSPEAAGIAAFEREHAEQVEFHAWLQWLADRQLGAAQQLARELGMPIGLYGDYAVGVNPSGAETWANQAVYRMGAGVGAPPDALALKGQDWGIPPQDPHALQAAGYAPFRELIASNMRHFGALRLDHVMALFRQWWVPVGLGATEGGYVHYPVDDLMSVLALESRRHGCMVVGEDLGTVPDEMRRAMPQYAVYSYKVLLFEKHGDGSFKRPDDYVRGAIATVTTHDLPTLRGWWEGLDLALRDRLSLFPGEEIRRYVHDERGRDRQQLLAALASQQLDAGVPADDGASPAWSTELSRAIHLYLAASKAALVVVQVEDLMGMTDPVNVPGTSHEHANWQRKVSTDLDTLFTDPAAVRLLDDMARTRSA
jgi:4-alpha-glucanotransferase